MCVPSSIRPDTCSWRCVLNSSTASSVSYDVFVVAQYGQSHVVRKSDRLTASEWCANRCEPVTSRIDARPGVHATNPHRSHPHRTIMSENVYTQISPDEYVYWVMGNAALGVLAFDADRFGGRPETADRFGGRPETDDPRIAVLSGALIPLETGGSMPPIADRGGRQNGAMRKGLTSRPRSKRS